MNKTKVIILIIVFLITASWGSFKHSLERGSGWIGGQVNYSYNYGKAYNWETGYDSLHGILKGKFPETKCGNLYSDTLEWTTRQPTESNMFISSEKCKTLMGLEEFVNRYSNRIIVGELIMKKGVPDEKTQIEMFNKWKTQGLLNDIRYKEVTIYDWKNIGDLLYRILLIPISITLILWLILKYSTRK
ncbi:MAG: hypothetical protein NTZ87_00910 [Candidatus Nomurabacteria bacterium]|nr:hypothetical protein [Candidatus Nomurabacteria bacterium]